jgi:S-formylglutathione hydrolase FrmB
LSFLDFHFFSESLNLTCAAHVILPQATTQQIGMTGGKKREKYPTLYLLHGLSDDHTIWTRRTSIERYAAERNIAVVMPAVTRSFYQDMASGPKFWTFLSEELPALCQDYFPLSVASEDTFAAGLSMGGYGALRLGLARPEKFAAVASLSGALDLARRLREAGKPSARIDRNEWIGIFGPELKAPTEANLWLLASKVASSTGPRPAIYLSCGTEDEILVETRTFRQHLDAIGLPLTYHESRGAHEWGYWDAEIQRVLAWLPVRQNS